jgi:drug/metabolite transporter (DMT)-like permease
LAKAAVATGLIGLVILLRGDFIPPLPWRSFGLLSLSGALGIAIGDTFYFRALQNLGARRTLLVGAMAPVLAALLAGIFLQEGLPVLAWLGMGLTILGVGWVISERTAGQVEPRFVIAKGFGFALLFALAQASGAVLSRAALAGTMVDPLWAAGIRLATGVALLIGWGIFRQQLWVWFASFQTPKRWAGLSLAAFMGTFLGIWLQQISLKYAAAGISQTLSSTSPLFVLPVAAWLGEKISWRALVGVLVALAGIGILFAG